MVGVRLVVERSNLYKPGSAIQLDRLLESTSVLMDVGLSFEDTAAAVLNLWPVCLFFGGLALLCSAVFHRRSLAVAIPAFLLFAMYLLDVMGRVSEDLEY